MRWLVGQSGRCETIGGSHGSGRGSGCAGGRWRAVPGPGGYPARAVPRGDGHPAGQHAAGRGRAGGGRRVRGTAGRCAGGGGRGGAVPRGGHRGAGARRGDVADVRPCGGPDRVWHADRRRCGQGAGGAGHRNGQPGVRGCRGGTGGRGGHGLTARKAGDGLCDRLSGPGRRRAACRGGLWFCPQHRARRCSGGAAAPLRRSTDRAGRLADGCAAGDGAGHRALCPDARHLDLLFPCGLCVLFARTHAVGNPDGPADRGLPVGGAAQARPRRAARGHAGDSGLCRGQPVPAGRLALGRHGGRHLRARPAGGRRRQLGDRPATAGCVAGHGAAHPGRGVRAAVGRGAGGLRDLGGAQPAARAVQCRNDLRRDPRLYPDVRKLRR